MIDPELLALLRCPDTRQPLHLAGPDVVRALNGRIARGDVKNRGGATVDAPCDGALVREDGRFLYPIRHEIPVLLVAEALAVGGEGL